MVAAMPSSSSAFVSVAVDEPPPPPLPDSSHGSHTRQALAGSAASLAARGLAPALGECGLAECDLAASGFCGDVTVLSTSWNCSAARAANLMRVAQVLRGGGDAVQQRKLVGPQRAHLLSRGDHPQNVALSIDLLDPTPVAQGSDPLPISGRRIQRIWIRQSVAARVLAAHQMAMNGKRVGWSRSARSARSGWWRSSASPCASVQLSLAQLAAVQARSS